ncbi:tyrosine-type recombinase/integrase [Anaerotignum sp.]|uniref:tyrosine-type recombinase/integrase n=1 Tax=Anaerotignum sp. TaxID=2039241 RepID=UPI0027152D8C|nr:site-specific integrase [Anaerotignum sp.]
MDYNITYREKDGGWQYIISYKDDRKWKQKSKQGFSLKKDAKKAAEKRLNELKKENELTQKADPEYRGITFGKFADDLIEHEKLYKSANTIKARKAAMKKFSAIKNIPLVELKNADIQKCVDKMVSSRLKTLTIKIHLVSIRYILGQAVKPHRVISVLPMEDIKFPPMQYIEGEKASKALEKNEISKLLEALKSKQTTLKYYYLCSFALGTGLRRGELLGLTWDNIDFRNRQVNVVRQWKLLDDGTEGFGTLKKKNSKRIVPISKNVIDELLEYKTIFNVIGIDNRVFPFKNNVVSNSFAKISKEIGFYVGVHMLRHTYATNLIANGVDFKTAASILGHDVEMTMKVYSHVTDEMMRKAAEKIDKIF